LGIGRYSPHNGGVHGLWFLWLFFGALAGPMEVVSRRLICAAASLGMLSAALAAALGASLLVQVAVAASVFGFGLSVHRLVLRPYHRAVINWETLYRSLSTTAKVTEPVGDYAGQVRYGGLNWQARSMGPTIPAGTRVTVSGLANDMTLWVYPT